MNERESHPPDDGWSRHVVEHVAAGVVIQQDGRLVYANPHAARLLGRGVDALVGVAPGSLLSDDERQSELESTAALIAHRSDEEYNEYRIVLPDGRTRQLAVSSTLTEWAGQPATVGVLHDISRQRAATAALRGQQTECS